MLKLLDISRFILMSLNFLHWIGICFTVKYTPQVSHISSSVFSMRYPWVNFVCPINNLFNTEFSFLRKFGLFHLAIEVFIFGSLVLCFCQYFSHSTSVIFLIWFLYQHTNVYYVMLYYIMLITCMLFSFASLSTCSFHLTSQCLGIHIKVILMTFFYFKIIYNY